MAVGPFGISTIGQEACFPELPCDDRGPLLFDSILVEDQANQRSALRFHCHVSIFDIVAKHGSSEYDSPLHLPGLSPFYPRGCFAALLLRDRAHDTEPQLRVRLQCADAVVHEQNPYANLPQLSSIGNRVQNVSGKSADLLCDNQLEFSHVGIVDHAVEGSPLFSGRTCDAFVSIDLIQFPVRLPFDVLFEVAPLALKGIGLVILVR